MEFKKQLTSLALELNKLSCFQEAGLLLKLAQSIYFYSFVPTEQIDSIFKYGLASSEYIKNNKELLKEIYPDIKEREKWLKRFDENDITLKGPSVFFSKPDLKKILKLDPKHPLSTDDFTLLRIDYSNLKKDYPDMKIIGTELVPYQDDEYESKKKEIEHELSEKELLDLTSRSFEETWKDYFSGGGFFAPNVPHGIILISKGYIPPNYLSIVK